MKVHLSTVLIQLLSDLIEEVPTDNQGVRVHAHKIEIQSDVVLLLGF